MFRRDSQRHQEEQNNPKHTGTLARQIPAENHSAGTKTAEDPYFCRIWLRQHFYLAANEIVRLCVCRTSIENFTIVNFFCKANGSYASLTAESYSKCA